MPKVDLSHGRKRPARGAGKATSKVSARATAKAAGVKPRGSAGLRGDSDADLTPAEQATVDTLVTALRVRPLEEVLADALRAVRVGCVLLEKGPVELMEMLRGITPCEDAELLDSIAITRDRLAKVVESLTEADARITSPAAAMMLREGETIGIGRLKS